MAASSSDDSGVGADDPYTETRRAQRSAMGSMIRSQRELANMSLREMARVTRVSNAYLSQLERGLHEPSMRVLSQIADALRLPVQDFLGEQGDDAPPTGDSGRASVEDAIRADPILTAAEKESLLTVYRSYRKLHESG